MSPASAAQVQQILMHQLQWLWDQPEMAIHISPIMLWGAPGIGKSSIIRSLCQGLGIGLIDVRLAQREPVDLRGLPVPDGDQVRWLLSSEWPRDPASKGIILFDELTAADRTLQVAAYEFILDRRLGDMYRVPPGWLICAAGNRSEDRAVSMTLSSALANRFCHLELQPDVQSWTNWASAQNLHPDVVGFLRFKPECFFQMSGNLERGWPSPRSWERVAHVIERSRDMDGSTLALILNGLVGPAAAVEFSAYRRASRELPDVNALLDGTLVFEAPQKADQRYALATSLAHYLWAPAAHQDRYTRIGNFLKIGCQLSSDFAVMAMLDALAKVSQPERVADAQMFLTHPEFANWQAKHGEGLRMSAKASKEAPVTAGLSKATPKSKE